MPVPSHCLPTGSLGNGELPVCNVSDGTVTISDPGAGLRRGICVFFHQAIPVQTVFPLPIPNSIGVNIQNFATSMVADGWVFAYPATPEDFYTVGTGLVGIANDVNLDPLHGTRCINGLLHWWDHMLRYLQGKYGMNRPICVAGFSDGGHKAMVIANQRPSTIIGAMSHAAPCLWENIVATPPPTFNAINWAGYDLSTTYLNGVGIPTIVGYSTTDGVVGFSAGSTPVNNLDQIITAAGVSCTRYSSTTDAATPYPNGHLYLPLDATQYQSWVTTNMDPLAPANAF